MPDDSPELLIETLDDGSLAVIAPQPTVFEATLGDALVKAVRRLVEEDRVRRVVLDLASLRYLDSAGIGMLLSCSHVLRGVGGSLGLIGVREPLRRILSTAMILQVIPVFQSAEEASEAFED